MTFIIASVIVMLTIIFGALAAWAFKGWDKAVVSTKENIEEVDRAYNPAITLGHPVNSKAPVEEQVKEARKLAAKRAAALPRGANMRIGYKEDPKLVTASEGLDQDPWTASKIAEFHGWDGARTGLPAGGVPEAVAAAPAAAAPAAGGKIELVPGKDYPVIEITDDMPPDEVRKARIANSKARSAAMKKAKEAGVAAAPAAAAPSAAAPAAAAAVAVGITAPKLIEITDDMPADEVRKARIANSKARSAFNKQLKEAGIDPKDVEIDDQGNVVMPQAAQAAAPAAPAAAPAQQAAAAASGSVDLAAMGISAPQLTEITDDMPADEVRQARINNSKARSAFNKQLKEAGIDPKTVEIDDSGNVVMKGGAAPAASAPAPAAQAAAVPAAPAAPTAGDGDVDLAALGISPPELVELTDEMSPDEKRDARIANSKARSAFNKQLKEAGIDPKQVKI